MNANETYDDNNKDFLRRKEDIELRKKQLDEKEKILIEKEKGLLAIRSNIYGKINVSVKTMDLFIIICGVILVCLVFYSVIVRGKFV